MLWLTRCKRHSGADILLRQWLYYDNYRACTATSNLIQAQRDYFGAHTYKRTDLKKVFSIPEVVGTNFCKCLSGFNTGLFLSILVDL